MRSSCFVGKEDFTRCLVHYTTMNRLWNLLRCNFLLCNHFRGVFPFFLVFFKSFFVILVIWINEVNSAQFSSTVKLRFLFRPCLLFSILSGFTNFRSNFWPYVIWSGCRLNLCQSHPGPHVSFWRLLFQKSEFCETFPRI